MNLEHISRDLFQNSIQQQLKIEKARRDILSFTEYTFSEFMRAKHNECICEYIDCWLAKEIQYLMIFTPPRYGKCVAKGSLITMADKSLKPIEDVKIGDQVLSIGNIDSLDEINKKIKNFDRYYFKKRRVVNKFSPGKKKVSKLTVIDIEDNEKILYTTKEHRFFATTYDSTLYPVNIGWVCLKDFLVNSYDFRGWAFGRKRELIDPKICNGKIDLFKDKKFLITLKDRNPCISYNSRVKEINFDCKEEEIFDLEIEGTHNYVANGIVVHNSEIISRRLPPYIMGRNPNTEVMAISYSQSLASFNSRKARSIVASEEYRDVFPGVGLVQGRTAVEDWETTNGSSYKCAGVGGGIGGRGYHYGLIDDYFKDRADAESPTKREALFDWYTSTFFPRRAPGAQILLITTRWHKEDLAGKLLTQEEEGSGVPWVVLNLPAICNSKDDILNRAIGEPLWPERYSLQEVQTIRKVVGKYDWASLYEGNPVPSGGEKINRAWFNIIDKEPEGLTWYRYWDLAVSSKSTADHTASIAIAKDDDNKYYLKDLIHGQWEWPKTKRIIYSTCKNEGPYVSVGVEQAGQQQGFVDDLIDDPLFSDYSISGYTVDADKLTRALPWIARAEAGRFYIVRGKWVNDYLDICQDFTGLGDARDDEIDATSGAYKMVNEAVDVNIRII